MMNMDKNILRTMEIRVEEIKDDIFIKFTKDNKDLFRFNWGKKDLFEKLLIKPGVNNTLYW